MLPTEVYYLIARFLREGPCVRAAQTLLDDIAAHPDLAMVRHDWEGRVHPLAFSEAVSCFLYLMLRDYHSRSAGLRQLSRAVCTHCSNPH